MVIFHLGSEHLVRCWIDDMGICFEEEEEKGQRKKLYVTNLAFLYNICAEHFRYEALIPSSGDSLSRQ